MYVTMTGPEQQLQDQLKALRAEYEAQLPGRLDELDAAFSGMPTDARAEDSRQALETLYALSHKLTGSAGTFGFMAIGEAAKRLEALCQSLLEDPDGATADGMGADGREKIAGLLSAVRDAAGKDTG